MSAVAPRLAPAVWPLDDVGEAMLAVAQRCGLGPQALDAPRVNVPPAESGEWTERAVERFSDWLGIEAEPVGCAYGDVPALVASAGPGIIALPGGGLIAAVGAKGRWLEVLAPDLRLMRVPAREICAALRAPLDERSSERVAVILDAVGVPARRRRRAREALLAQQLVGERIEAGWLLRLPPGRPTGEQLRRSGISRRLVSLFLAHAAQYVVWMGAWWMLGRGALEGRLETGWLAAWALALLTVVPLRAYAAHAQGAIAIDAGVLLKRRLLAGALALEPEDIRTEGAGRLLGRVLESEAVESMAVAGGFATALAAVELAVGAWVLSLGAAPGVELGALGVCVALAAALSLVAHARRGAWSEARVGLTHDLVERIAGHRTRLAQERPDAWHQSEDRALVRTFELGRRMDAAAATTLALVPRAWLVVSLVAVALLSGARTSASLALTVGGALLVQTALQRAMNGAAALSGAWLAWGRVRSLFRAAERAPAPPSPHVGLAEPGTRPSDAVVLEARGIVFRHAGRDGPLLRDLSLRIEARDRVLLEGSSGAGKSTLGAIVAGLREPQSGLVLVDGLDRKTLGSTAWRRRVAAAPQFHENHVLGASFAFNLLMGRRWPPRPSDLEEALAVCRELDLGPLLERMPAGLEQMVGETGWQLSHGEKSRLFVARALLQGAELVVLDESVTALDPRTLHDVVEAILRRAGAVLLIAHP